MATKRLSLVFVGQLCGWRQLKRLSALLLLLPAVTLAATTPSSRPTRGYTARACGFDLDDDFVYGETADCNVCDGTSGTGPVTVDYDGDSSNETEVYIDCTSGSNSNTGGPSDPYLTLSYAIGQEGAGEIAYCIKGTCTGADLNFTYSGAAGTKTKTAAGSEEWDFQYPSQPLMVIGWDTDDDGSYPPYDTDETAVLSGNAITDYWFDLSSSRVEFAHFSVSANTSSDGSEWFWKIGSQGNAAHWYVHDFEITSWMENQSNSGGNGVIGHWPNATTYNYLAFENILCSECGGGYFLRGSAGDNDQHPGYAGSNYLRLQNIEIAVDCNDGGSDGFWVSKPWGETQYLEWLDSYVDYQAGDQCIPDTSPASDCFGAAQCAQNIVIRNNTCVGGGRFVHFQASASSFCETRPICNTTSGSGTGCVIDGNEFIHDYGYIDDQFLQQSDGGLGSTAHGDIYVTNNVLNASTAMESCLELNGTIISGADVHVVGNTFEGSLDSGQGCLKTGSVSAQYEVHGNIFGTNQYSILASNAPSSWSANYNAYPTGTSLWVWNSSPQSTLANWQSASGGDGNARQCTPTYASASDFHLNASDTCAIDYGTNITSYTSIDYDGDSRPTSNSDIGADEYTSGVGDLKLTGVVTRGIVID